MVIGIDASRANREHKTGTEWYSYYLIRELAKLDDKNQYILYTNTPLKGGLVDLIADKNEYEMSDIEGAVDKGGWQKIDSPHDNFKARVLKWPFNFFWTQGRLSYEMIFRQPDVLFVPAHALPIIHPKNSAVTIHDVGFERDRMLYRKENMVNKDKIAGRTVDILVRLFTGGKYGANSLDYLHWSTKYSLKKSKKIITVSQFTKDEIINIYGHEFADKIRVISNGYNDKLYRKMDDKDKIAEVTKVYGISDQYILYVGRLEKKKNTSLLIEAFALIKERNKSIKHKLVLVGDPGFGYDDVKYTIREYNLDDEVIIPGWIKEINMPYVFNGASVFVLPSLYEGFGIPLLQAMGCEVPIAASNVSSIPEVTGKAAILFNPKNVLSMAEAIEKVIIDDGLKNELIRLGNARCREFSWKICAQNTLDFLNS